MARQTYGTVIEALYLLALHPEVQARAYAEIEAALGSSTSDQLTILERLPSITDRPALPYVNALVKEVYRYNPVVPMGLPRRSEKDGWLGGKFIVGPRCFRSGSGSESLKLRGLAMLRFV